MSGVVDLQAAIDVLQQAQATLAALHDDGAPGQEPDPVKCVTMHAAARNMRHEVEARMTRAGLWQEAAQSVRVSNGLGALLHGLASASCSLPDASNTRDSLATTSSGGSAGDEPGSTASASQPSGSNAPPPGRASEWFPGLVSPTEEIPPASPTPSRRQVKLYTYIHIYYTYTFIYLSICIYIYEYIIYIHICVCIYVYVYKSINI